MITIRKVRAGRPGTYWSIARDGVLIDTALTKARAVKIAREKYGFDPKQVSTRTEATKQRRLV